MSNPHAGSAQGAQLDGSGDGALEPVSRSTEFWFKDGSIVLLAEKTMFRVHSSVLSLNSSVLRDIFNVLQPENETLVEGCPVVLMHDKADDWCNLLKYIYHTSPILMYLPYFILGSLMRLAEKYQFMAIRSYGLEELKRDIPQSNFASMTEYMDKNKWRNIADIINIAIELNIRSILPVPYYLCATYFTTHQIIHGVPGGFHGDVRLAPEAQHLLLVGRNKLDVGVKDHLMEWLLEPSSKQHNGAPVQCSTPEKCSRAQGAYVMEYSKLVEVERYRWVERVSDDFGRFCENCSTAAKYQRDQGTAAFWRALPSYFDLPAWENLRDLE